MLHSLSLRYALTRALDIVMLAIIDIDTDLARSVLLLLIKQRLVPGLCANKKFVHGPLRGQRRLDFMLASKSSDFPFISQRETLAYAHFIPNSSTM